MKIKIVLFFVVAYLSAFAQHLNKSEFFGGTNYDEVIKTIFDTNYTYTLSYSKSNNFSYFNNLPNDNDEKIILSKFNLSGNLLNTFFIGYTKTITNIFSDFKILNDTAYIVYSINDQNNSNFYNKMVYSKYNMATSQTMFNDTVGASLGYIIFPFIEIDSLAKNTFITFQTLNQYAIPTTDSLLDTLGVTNSIYYHYNNNNQLIYSSYIPINRNNLIFYNNKLYIFSANNNYGTHFLCIDVLNDTILYENTIQGGNTPIDITNTLFDKQNKTINVSYKNRNSGLNQIIIYDTLLNILNTIDLGYTSTANNKSYQTSYSKNYIFATTDTLQNAKLKIFTFGNLVYNTTLNNLTNIHVLPSNDALHIIANGKNFITTNQTKGSGNSDALVYLKLDTINYDICYSTYIGGTKMLQNYYTASSTSYLSTNKIKVRNDEIHIIGNSNLSKMPKTSGTFNGDFDTYYAVFNTNTDLQLLIDTITPSTQTVCKNGMAEKLIGNVSVNINDSVPIVYFGSAAHNQIIHNPITYQWQEANTQNSTFTNITNATNSSYLPQVGLTDMYYRRITTLPSCDTFIELISDTIAVLVNNNFAPTVNAGGTFHTCPNVPITIGNNNGTTNGTPPYNYLWSNGDTTQFSTFSPIKTGIYTLIVSDSNNCKQFDQAAVHVHQAKINAPTASCAEDTTILRANIAQGLTGVNYQWYGNNMCCPNSAVNKVRPTSNQSYILELTIPITNGGYCTTSDTISLIHVNSPTPNFAGADQLVCLGSEVVVGTTEQIGFDYSWSPNNIFIEPTDSAIAVLNKFNGNSIFFDNQMPIPNPLPIVAQMSQYNCTFYDTAYIAFMEAVMQTNRNGNPYDLYCNIDTIGHLDRSPNIQENYFWTQLSGNAQIVGSTTNSQLAINNNSSTTTSEFQLSASATFNGISNTCNSTVRVNPYYVLNKTMSSCFPIIYNNVEYTQNTIIKDTISGGMYCDTIKTVTIRILEDCVQFCEYFKDNKAIVEAHYSLPYNMNLNFMWSVEIGSQNNVNVVSIDRIEISDNQYRRLKLTITSSSDSTLVLEYYIDVNGGSWNPLVFNTTDTSICVNSGGIFIGNQNNSNYTYNWRGPENFISFSSNPYVVPPNIGINNYTVEIREGNCLLKEKVNINVLSINENLAGTNYQICENAIITLGNPNNDVANIYHWEPSNAPWQNGTDENSSNPEVLIAISTDFIVAVSDTNGICSLTDTVSITVNNSPELDIPDFDICKNTPTLIGVSGISGASFSWSPAIGLSCTTCQQPEVTLSNNQTYQVNILFEGDCVNPNYVDVVNVNVFSTPPNMEDIEFCPKQNNIIVGTDAPTNMNNYQWQPSYLLNNANNRVASLINTDIYTIETFILNFTDNNNCEVKDTVNLIPNITFPIAEAGNDQVICLGDNIILGNNNFDSTAAYSWNPTTFLSSPNSAYTYFSPTDTGVYSFVLSKQEGSSSCSSTDTVTIYVTKPNIDNQSYLLCQNSCDSLGFAPQEFTTYTWSPANYLSNPNIANPIACNIQNDITYTLTATDNFGCEAIANISVSIYNNIPPSVSINDTIVFTGSIFTLNTSINPLGNYYYNWGNNSYVINNSTPNGQFLIQNEGQYTFVLDVIDSLSGCITSQNVTVTAIDQNNIHSVFNACDSLAYENTVYYSNQIITDTLSNDSVVYNFINIHNTTYNSINLSFCDSILINENWYNESSTFTDTFSTIYNCDSIITFNISKNISNKITIDTSYCANESFSYNFGGNIISIAGNYVHNFYNTNGCDSIVYLTVIEKPISLFSISSIDSTLCSGDTIILNANSLFGDTLQYFWDNNTENPIFIATENISTTLRIEHSNKCFQNIPINMLFKDCISTCSILTPTGFSPNHDNINDRFVLFHNCKYGISNFSIKIYNRWGELVFFSNNINDTWNGMYKNKPAPIGVYSYSIEYFKNGDTKNSEQSGNITLIR